MSNIDEPYRFARTFGDLMDGLGNSYYDLENRGFFSYLVTRAEEDGVERKLGLRKLRSIVCKFHGIDIDEARRKSLREFVELVNAAETNKPDEPKAAKLTGEGPKAVASSPSGRAVLYGRADKPIVDGKELPKLTNAQYDVVLTLLTSDTVGLTKDELEGNKTGRGGGRSVLYRLKEKPGWKAVIQLAGKTGNGYRIL